MFVGWYDPDPKRPASAKLAQACERYRAKFGAEPECALVGPRLAEALAREGVAALPVRAAAFLPANTLYVGVEERS